MVPFTYYQYFDNLDDERRLLLLRECCDNGATNLVLTEALLKGLAGVPGLRKTLKKQINDCGITFIDAHSPFGPESDLMLPDDMRSLGLARQMLTLELVHDFGVKTCCFHLGNAPSFPEYSLDQLRSFICKTLEKLLKRAEELDIIICIENVFKPLNTVSEINGFIKKFDSPYLGVCYDAGHANIMENGMKFPDSRPWGQWENRGDVEWEHDVLEQLLPHIVICHLHDNDAAQDQHNLPGNGTIDWQKTLTLLRQAPRLTSMQSEVIVPRNGGFSIRRLVDTWNDYLSRY